MDAHYGKHAVPSLDLITKLAQAGRVLLTRHAVDEALADAIDPEALRASMAGPLTLVADYPEDPRGHSCLVRCTHPTGTWHVNCAVTDPVPGEGLAVIVITVYRPRRE